MSVAEAPSTSPTGECPACRAEGVELKDVGGLMICGNCSSKRFSNKVREQIEQAMAKQEAVKAQDAWRKRLDTAKRGVRLFQEDRYPEALKTLLEYIVTLERKFGVDRGGLHPALFDQHKDAAELLLVAGIFWDLAKIHDQMKGAAHQAELKTNLNKFIEFSLEKPHLILASEGVRKYLKSGKCKNVEDFKHAHEFMRSKLSRCFIAGAVYGPQSPQVQALQSYRDDVLLHKALGRVFVRLYYQLSPAVALVLARSFFVTRFVRKILNPIVRYAAIRSTQAIQSKGQSGWDET